MIFSRVTACMSVKNCTGDGVTLMSSRRDRYLYKPATRWSFFYIAGALCAAARLREVCPHHIPIALSLIVIAHAFCECLLFVLFGYVDRDNFKALCTCTLCYGVT